MIWIGRVQLQLWWGMKVGNYLLAPVIWSVIKFKAISYGMIAIAVFSMLFDEHF